MPRKYSARSKTRPKKGLRAKSARAGGRRKIAGQPGYTKVERTIVTKNGTRYKAHRWVKDAQVKKTDKILSKGKAKGATSKGATSKGAAAKGAAAKGKTSKEQKLDPKAEYEVMVDYGGGPMKQKMTGADIEWSKGAGFKVEVTSKIDSNQFIDRKGNQNFKKALAQSKNRKDIDLRSSNDASTDQMNELGKKSGLSDDDWWGRSDATSIYDIEDSPISTGEKKRLALSEYQKSQGGIEMDSGFDDLLRKSGSMYQTESDIAFSGYVDKITASDGYLTVYRGVKQTPRGPGGNSWTTNMETARSFAGGSGNVITARVKRNEVYPLGYLRPSGGGGESEIFVPNYVERQDWSYESGADILKSLTGN